MVDPKSAVVQAWVVPRLRGAFKVANPAIILRLPGVLDGFLSRVLSVSRVVKAVDLESTLRILPLVDMSIRTYPAYHILESVRGRGAERPGVAGG